MITYKFPVILLAIGLLFALAALSLAVFGPSSAPASGKQERTEDANKSYRPGHASKAGKGEVAVAIIVLSLLSGPFSLTGTTLLVSSRLDRKVPFGKIEMILLSAGILVSAFAIMVMIFIVAGLAHVFNQ
ncbi:MAG TPA: hypothetical protein DCO77_07580 [Nitrospiraceae bacterium]|nr:hypothetical protein [Nitrospiraceae bacterium]